MLFTKTKIYSKSEELEEENIIRLNITDTLLQCLKTTFEIGKQRKILWVLSNDSLYPQLARASAALRMITHCAEYIAGTFKESPKQDYKIALILHITVYNLMPTLTSHLQFDDILKSKKNQNGTLF